MVLKDEQKFMKQLSIEYMSEESDCPNNSNAIIVHPIPWRSESNGYLYIIPEYSPEPVIINTIPAIFSS